MLKPNVKDLSFKELEDRLGQHRQPSYRSRQVWQWLFQKRACAFAEMTNLSASLREQLESEFSISRLDIVRRQESRDGTVKFLFGLSDHLSVESVLIPETKRLTLCISTQAGCGFGCVFCATARMGLKRNLRSSEILDQILETQRLLTGERRITHVVLMGMGEPLANYAQTIRALEIMTDASWGLGLSPRKLTLSTVGLLPQIRRLMEDTRVNLAISLHAPTEELRGRIMPVNRKYSLGELIECCRSLPLPRRKRITFEYVLLRGINDLPEHAQTLSRLLEGIRCKVNVIPFNPHRDSPFQRPTDTEIGTFQSILQARGIQINVRRPRGDDIQAACGQLQGAEGPEQRDESRLAAEGR